MLTAHLYRINDAVTALAGELGAQVDGASRSDLLEGIVLLARDHAEQRGPGPRTGSLRPARG